MKKPTAEEYGLTQEDIEHYLEQKKLFDTECREHFATNEKISFFISWAISTVVMFIIVSLGGSTVYEENTWLFFLIPIMSAIFPNIFILEMFSPFEFLNKVGEIKPRYPYLKFENQYNNYQTALYEYERYLKQINREYWLNMTGFQFEKEVASLFRDKGYEASVTSATADGGVDIYLTKGGERIAVQCKHHAKPIGPNDVRALQGVVASQNYSKGIFVSLNGYTSTVYQEVRRGAVQIELLELRDILRMAEEDDEDIEELDEDQIEELPEPIEEVDMKFKPHLGDAVIHKHFGKGIISRIFDGNHIQVYFMGINSYKNFLFPDAFENNFIVFCDSEEEYI